RSVKDHSAAGGQHAAVEPDRLLYAPRGRMLDRVPRDELALEAARPGVDLERIEAEIEQAVVILDLVLFGVHAEVVGGQVNQAGVGVVRHRLPVLAAKRAGTCYRPS